MTTPTPDPTTTSDDGATVDEAAVCRCGSSTIHPPIGDGECLIPHAAAVPTSPTDTGDGLREALYRLDDLHNYDPQMSQNLGYYRTGVTCRCGVSLWWGEHDGDPTYAEVWYGHLADALNAALTPEGGDV